MLEHSVVGIYKTVGEAQAAVISLTKSGFPVKKISLVARHLDDKRSIHGFAMACDEAKPAAVTGLWLGGIFGICLAGAGFFWVPEFGPLVVAGSVAEALICWLEGSVGGGTILGVLGLLVGLADSRKIMWKYEAALRDGKFLVIARGSMDQLDKARDILSGSQAEEIDLHRTDSTEDQEGSKKAPL